MTILGQSPRVRSTPWQVIFKNRIPTLFFLTVVWIHSSCTHLKKYPSPDQASGETPNALGVRMAALTAPYKSVQSPVVKVGPCLGAKIEKNRYLFPAPCLFVGASSKLRLEFVAGSKTTLMVDNGEHRTVTIDEIFVAPEFDPLVSREELRMLGNPRSRGFTTKILSDWDAQFDYRDHVQPHSMNIALVKIRESLQDIPLAYVGPDPPDGTKLVMVSNFGCSSRNKDQNAVEHPDDGTGFPMPWEFEGLAGSDQKFIPHMSHDPASILLVQRSLIFVEGAQVAFPKVPSLEPLCWGTSGSPIMALTPQGFRLVGLSLGRTKGILVGARVGGPMLPKIGLLIQRSWLKPQGEESSGDSVPQKYHLSCAQVLVLLPDGSPREYGFSDLELALMANNEVTAAVDSVVLAIEPHDRPPYKLPLDLADHCTTKDTLCYVGVFHDPVSAGVQVVKLEVSAQGAAIAHWISADGGARTTPLDVNSCQLSPLNPP